MLLLDKIKDDLKVAQRENDDVKVSTLRFLLSKVDYARIDNGQNLNDDEVITEVSKEAKRHLESIAAYKAANRADLYEKEKELEILKSYLPEPYSEQQTTNMVDEAIKALDAKSVADMGRVVKAVMSSGSGKADGAKVAEIVRRSFLPKVKFVLSIQISTDTRYPINRKLIRKAVDDTLKKHAMGSADTEVSVTVVGRRKMKDITDKYLGDGRMHEVLSFPLEEISQTTSGEHGFINAPDGVLRLGDVVLCYPEVILAAARDDVLVDQEVYNLCAHGVDHLLGEHHE